MLEKIKIKLGKIKRYFIRLWNRDAAMIDMTTAIIKNKMAMDDAECRLEIIEELCDDKFSAIEKKLDIYNHKLDCVVASYGPLKEDIASCIESRTNHAERIVRLGDMSQSFKVLLEVFNGKMKDLENKILALDDSLNCESKDIRKEISNVNNSLADAKSHLSGLQSDVDGINDAITELDLSLSEHIDNDYISGDIHDIKIYMDGLPDEDRVKELVEEHETVSNCVSDIETVNEQVSAIKQTLTSLSGKMECIENSMLNQRFQMFLRPESTIVPNLVVNPAEPNVPNNVTINPNTGTPLPENQIVVSSTIKNNSTQTDKPQ